MPHPTFLKLPASKRERIELAARAEFALNEFADARLDRIAKAASVPKGSLYQYFEDKAEFYRYTVQRALDEIWESFDRHVAEQPPVDCFQLLREALTRLAWRAKHEPHLSVLHRRVVYAHDFHCGETILAASANRDQAFYDRLINWGVETRQVDPSTSRTLLRFHIHATAALLQHDLLSGDRPPWMESDTSDPDLFIDQLIDGIKRVAAPCKNSPENDK